MCWCIILLTRVQWRSAAGWRDLPRSHEPLMVTSIPRWDSEPLFAPPSSLSRSLSLFACFVLHEDAHTGLFVSRPCLWQCLVASLDLSHGPSSWFCFVTPDHTCLFCSMVLWVVLMVTPLPSFTVGTLHQICVIFTGRAWVVCFMLLTSNITYSPDFLWERNFFVEYDLWHVHSIIILHVPEWRHGVLL